MTVKTEPARASVCQREAILAGGAYPRTCPTCGLVGPCVKGIKPIPPQNLNINQWTGATSPVPDTPGVIYVPISAEMFALLTSAWSRPVQVRIAAQGNCTVELVFREPEEKL